MFGKMFVVLLEVGETMIFGIIFKKHSKAMLNVHYELSLRAFSVFVL